MFPDDTHQQSTMEDEASDNVSVPTVSEYTIGSLGDDAHTCYRIAGFYLQDDAFIAASVDLNDTILCYDHKLDPRLKFADELMRWYAILIECLPDIQFWAPDFVTQYCESTKTFREAIQRCRMVDRALEIPEIVDAAEFIQSELMASSSSCHRLASKPGFLEALAIALRYRKLLIYIN